MRQGIAPWRGRGDAFSLVCFFLMRGAAITSSHCRSEGSRQSSFQAQATTLRRTGKPSFRDFSYFLNKLLKAARASSALRGAGLAVVITGALADGAMPTPSLATVTRGRKTSHVLA
jgi:hypothetical protein